MCFKKLGVVLMSAAMLMMMIVPGAFAVSPAPDDAIPRISVEELKAMIEQRKPITIVDVRGGDYESSATRIKGALRIPPAEIATRWKDVPPDKPIVTYCACATDGGAVNAARTLIEHGYKNVRALKGGWNAWNDAGGPVEPK